MKNFKTYGQFVNENAKKFKQFWDKGPETGIRKKFGKDYDKAVGNRVNILLSLTDNPDKAENWATMDFLQLPNGISTQLLNMNPKEIDRILDEAINEYGPMRGSGNRNYSTNDLVDRIGDLDDILMSDRKAEREWEEMSQNYLDGERGSEYWGDLGDQELQDAIDDAEYLMKKYRIKESVVSEGSNTIANLNKMALTDLERICDYANMIKDRMTQGQELDAWMYSKISDSVKNLNSVHDTMDGTDGTTEE